MPGVNAGRVREDRHTDPERLEDERKGGNIFKFSWRASAEMIEGKKCGGEEFYVPLEPVTSRIVQHQDKLGVGPSKRCIYSKNCPVSWEEGGGRVYDSLTPVTDRH